MSAVPQKYIFIDPFGRPDSGVTTYTQTAAARISQLGLVPVVVAKRQEESLQAFRERVPNEICGNEAASVIVCVEAPESLASSSRIPDRFPLHIRLHCSRSLGAAVQGLKYDQRDVIAEQRELDRACFVSSPSWASVVASGILFHVPDGTISYPNPSLSFSEPPPTGPPANEVLFLGRLHRLKGFHYLIRLAELLPHRSFVVACPPDGHWSGSVPGNVRFVDGHSINKRQLFWQARVVVVPSIFETASMVGLEALSADTPVVTWEHIGLAEYASPPWVLAAPSGDVKTMSRMVDTAYENAVLPMPPNPIRIINSDFDIGVLSVVEGNPCHARNLRQPKEDVITYIRQLPQLEGVKMQHMNLIPSPFMRKLRKLRRDPVAFFQDSKGTVGFVFRLFLRHFNKSRRIQIPLTSPEKTMAVLGGQLFGKITRTGLIKFADIGNQKSSHGVALFYPVTASKSSIATLCDALNLFTDFSNLRKGMLRLGEFDVSEGTTALDILNRITRENKERLSKLESIVILDAPSALCRSLRSSGSVQKLVLVLTKNDEHTMPDPDCVDALIVVGRDHPASDFVNFRRKIVIELFEQLPTAIRRVIQESGAKKPDMLLPLINCYEYQRDKFMQFNPGIYQGIINLRDSEIPAAATMHEFCIKLAENIVSMAILESIYMRYRSLCEEIENGGSPARLIEYCLCDGVLLHVETA